MRALVSFSFAALAASALGFAAEAQTPWYVSGDLGGYFREDESNPVTFFKVGQSVTASGEDRAHFDPGLLGDVALGYRLGSHVRLEAQLGYVDYSIGHINPSTADPNFPNLNGQTFSRMSGADVSRFTGSLNGFYDFSTLASRFTPYVGLGVGGSDNRRSRGIFTASNGTPFTLSGNASPEAMGLVEGGVAIRLSPHWSFVPAYRYTRYFRSNQDTANVAKVGLRYDF